MTPKRGRLTGGWTDPQGIAAGEVPTDTVPADPGDILDALDVPVVVLRPNLRIAYFNQAALDVLGLLPSDVGRASREIPVLAGVPSLEELCARACAVGVESRTDVRDGHQWFVVRISPYGKGDRQAAGTVLTFTNVTAFRASIDQAIYERECTKAIVNTVADPLVVLSADLRIQSGNRAFYAVFGVSREEAQGTPLDKIAAFELSPLRTRLNEMLGGAHVLQPVEVEHVVTGKAQRTLMLDARPLSFPGHAERRILVTFQDITARKQAEAAKDLRSREELRRSEAFLADGQRLSLTGTFSWRIATDEITWSEQLYRIYGLELGVPVTLELIRTRVHPEDVTLLEKMIEQARDGGHDFEWQYRLLMPDRSIKYLHAVAHAIRDEDGQPEYIAAIQDVTARRLSEEALTRARSELAHVSRVTSLGALTASIAHEVNQPLSGIVTNASTGLRMLAASPPNLEGARETLQRTIRDGHRASEVVTRLRGLFARKEATVEPVDLNEATCEVIALSTGELRRSRVTVRPDLDEELPTVPGDRVQLQQVILNLLLNAADAMSGVDDRPRELVVRTARAGDGGAWVCLSVQDAGVGFAPEDAERLFEAFYTTKSQGMGIGLSVSRSIIERHRGRLWAERNDGPGSTFAFTIPVGPEDRTPYL